jgi:cytochrome c oxidase subunit 3
MTDPNAYTRSRAATSFVGMAVFLGGWAMMFAALFFAYCDVRLSSAAWPPAGEPRAPLALPSLATLALAGASLALARANRARAPSLAPPLALGAAFLALQSLVWLRLAAAGLRASSLYGSVFWTVTLFHALHVLIGLMGLMLLNATKPHFQTRLRNWTLYWHGVGIVWLVMFATVYVW